MQHQEREAEHPEGVLGPQLAVLDVHVELLGEAVHRQRGELRGVRVDVGQVVAGVVVVARLVSIRPPPGRARGSSVAVKLACGSGKPTLT